jgi:gas vesicle protein
MNNSEKFLYLIAGTGIGAALGILFAPRTGQEMRSTIATQAHKGMDLLSEKVGEGKRFMQERGGTAGSSVRSMVDRGRQAINDSVESVRGRFNESVETGIDEYQAQRGSLPRDRGIH